MDKYNIPADHVIRHYDVNGKPCPGVIGWNADSGDESKWIDFKARVTGDVKWYRIRKTWADVPSQLGAYQSLDGAKANCPAGYSVFDHDGNAVYTAEWSASGIPPSKEDFITAVAEIAQDLYAETKILPSVVIAQACLESGYGLGTDNLPLTKVSNILGMKTDLINSTWSEYSVWGGKSITKLTPEEYNGVKKMVNAPFRVYTDYRNCIVDYERFLLYVKNNAGYKYRSVQGKTDPEEVITIISKGGYATDSSYITSVMRVLNENNFTKYDSVVQSTDNVYTEKETAATTLLDACEQIRKAVESGGWVYSNSNQSPTFAEALAKGNKRVNCALAICWGLKMIGDLTSGSFWGSNGKITWKTGVKKELTGNGYQIIKCSKTVDTAIKDGTLKAGDICTYAALTHTNLYGGNRHWYDFGRGYSGGNTDGVPLTKVYGDTIYGNYKLAYIIRKSSTKESSTKNGVKYRVRIGIYSVKSVLANTRGILNGKGYATFEETVSGGTALYCGSFKTKTNAEARVKALKKIKISGKALAPVIETV